MQPLWRTVWRFLKKLEIELPYDPAISLLGIHTEETRIERDTCTPMFAALFIIARTWKQPRYPSADEWIRKLWYIYIMEHYSAIKKNTFESILMRWIKLEPIIQSEVSQKEKHQYNILMHINVKEGSEKVGLNLNSQKTKIMASGPITSWQRDGETLTDFILGGSKITGDGDCSHEIKRRLLLGRKVLTNLDSIFKSRDITLSTKV